MGLPGPGHLPQRQAGRIAFDPNHPEGSAPIPFTLLRRSPTKGRFQGFSPDDVIYLAMPDRFANGDPANDNPATSPGMQDRTKPRHYHGGDFAGITERLPYLQQLGVTALWLTPWYDNANHLNHLEKYTADNQRSLTGSPSTDYHGYGAVDFYGVEEHFGDLRGLQDLVRAAHRRGLKIIQDQVANHTGPYHGWTTNSPTSTWYNGTVDNHIENTWQTWTIADPNPPPDKFKATLEGWFINILPDLNHNDPETACYLIQNSLWWVSQTGLDAVRQDTLPYVPGPTGRVGQQRLNANILVLRSWEKCGMATQSSFPSFRADAKRLMAWTPVSTRCSISLCVTRSATSLPNASRRAGWPKRFLLIQIT